LLRSQRDYLAPRAEERKRGWFIPPPTIGGSGTDYMIRAIIARIGLTANAPKEAVYFAGMGMLDSDGNPLTGEKN